MRTRDVLRWHLSTVDLAEIVIIAVAGLALGVVDCIACALENWIDQRAAGVEHQGKVHDA